METITYIGTGGLALISFLFGLIVAPFLLGLPIEMWFSSNRREPIQSVRAWLNGIWFILIISAMYVIGYGIKHLT